MTVALEAIERALSSGKYRVDVERGLVYGPTGTPLGTQPARRARYATVSLGVSGMSRPQVSVETHKAVAYAIWGRAAFAGGVHVRHLNSDRTDNRKANLVLGSAPDNALDAPRAARVGRLRRARAGQRARGRCSLLSHEETLRLQA